MKKLIVAFCLVFAVMLAGCAATPEIPTSSPVEAAQATPEAVTLFDTATLKIVLEGAETTITDKTTGTEYATPPPENSPPSSPRWSRCKPAALPGLPPTLTP